MTNITTILSSDNFNIYVDGLNVDQLEKLLTEILKHHVKYIIDNNEICDDIQNKQKYVINSKLSRK